MTRTRSLRSLAAVLGLSAAYAAGTAGGAPQGLDKTVGVVDFDRVYNAHKTAGAREKAMDAAYSKVTSALAKRRKDVQELEDLAGGMDPNTRDGALAHRRAETAKFQWNYDKKTAISQRKLDFDRHHDAVFDDIEDAAAKVAAGLKLELVLRYRKIPTELPIGARLALRQQRDLIWHAETIDITDQVIALMAK